MIQRPSRPLLAKLKRNFATGSPPKLHWRSSTEQHSTAGLNQHGIDAHLLQRGMLRMTPCGQQKFPPLYLFLFHTVVTVNGTTIRTCTSRKVSSIQHFLIPSLEIINYRSSILISTPQGARERRRSTAEAQWHTI